MDLYFRTSETRSRGRKEGRVGALLAGGGGGGHSAMTVTFEAAVNSADPLPSFTCGFASCLSLLPIHQFSALCPSDMWSLALFRWHRGPQRVFTRASILGPSRVGLSFESVSVAPQQARCALLLQCSRLFCHHVYSILQEKQFEK